MKEQKAQEKVEATEGQKRSVSFSRHHCSRYNVCVTMYITRRAIIQFIVHILLSVTVPLVMVLAVYLWVCMLKARVKTSFRSQA